MTCIIHVNIRIEINLPVFLCPLLYYKLHVHTCYVEVFCKNNKKYTKQRHPRDVDGTSSSHRAPSHYARTYSPLRPPSSIPPSPRRLRHVISRELTSTLIGCCCEVSYDDLPVT